MLNSAKHEFIPLINVKIPTIVGILTFISIIISTTSEILKARNFFTCHLYLYEQLKFCVLVKLSMKKICLRGMAS